MGRVLEWWLERRQAAPLLIVPARADVGLLTLELLARVSSLSGPPPVITFDGLVTAVLGRPPALLGEVERQLVLSSLLGEAPLPGLGGLAGLPGTPSALARVFRELDEAGLQPEDVLAGLLRWAAADGGLLAADLALLYRGLQEAGETRQAADRPVWVRRACEVLSGWDRPLACYGFTSFTPVQRLLLHRLASRVPLLLALPWEAGGSLAALTAQEVAFWRPLASRVEQLPRQERVFSSPTLARLEAAVAAGAPEVELPGEEEGEDGGVRFLLASGRRNEVELAAREIVSLLRRGVAPDHIAVLVRGVTPWRQHVAQVFRRYGIPYRLDARVPMSATGLGHALLRGLRALLEGDTADLLGFVRSAYGGVDPGVVDGLEVALRRQGLVGRVAGFRRVLETFPEPLGLLGSALDQESQPARLRLAELPEVAVGLLRVAARSGALNRSRLEEDARALGVLQRAVLELESGLRGLEASHSSGGHSREVARELRLLGQVPVPLGREDERGVVHVLDLARARPRRYHVVFLLGLVDGEFPGGESRPALLSPEQRGAANRAAGVSLFPEPPERAEEALFAFALSRPWQLLYLSARDTEDEGGEVRPSPFWEAARRRLPRAQPVRRGLDEVVHPGSDAPSPREYLRFLVASGIRAGQEGGAGWAVPPLPAFRRPPRLSLPLVVAELAGRAVFPARELETYASCPFAWFLGEQVGLESIELELDGRHLGRAVHLVLAAVYRALRTEGLLPLGPEGLGRALALARHHLSPVMEGLEGYGDQAEQSLAREETEQRLETFLRFDAASESRLTPVWFELAFGRDGEVDLAGLRLSGRIDRVDAFEGGEVFFVVDYKNGRHVPDRAFSEEGALQVPLYLLALRALYPQAEIAGGAYAALGSDKRKALLRASESPIVGAWSTDARRLADEDFEGELEACLAAARAAAAGMRSAIIEARPPRQCPRYCDLRPLCRGRERRKLQP